MKLIIFGATGRVGAGALREALNDPEVESVLSVGRHACGVEHPKLRELLLRDRFDFTAVEPQPVGCGRADRFILESGDINRVGA